MASETPSDSRENNNNGFHPAPPEEWELLFQGAEAKVWKLHGNNSNNNTSNDEDVFWVCKERFSKAYRHPDLDQRLTKSRCRSEARILEKCKQKSDICVPGVIRTDPPLIFMDYLKGPTVRQYLQEKQWESKQDEVLSSATQEDMNKMATLMGSLVAKLHNIGVIHGDLTTSNMMVVSSSNDDTTPELALIDFGLAKSSNSVEEQAVDLYVLERAVQSTHPGLPETFFSKLLEAYSDVAKPPDKKAQQTTLQRLEQVRQRGRKRECFG